MKAKACWDSIGSDLVIDLILKCLTSFGEFLFSMIRSSSKISNGDFRQAIGISKISSSSIWKDSIYIIFN